MEGPQSKAHVVGGGEAETLVRLLVLILSRLHLYRMWRSGYIPIQLPQKAANSCFIFVESI